MKIVKTYGKSLLLAAMALGIVYASGTLAKLYSFKKRLFSKSDSK